MLLSPALQPRSVYSPPARKESLGSTLRDLPLPVGAQLATGPGSERSWEGSEEVSQLFAEMGMGGRSQQN